MFVFFEFTIAAVQKIEEGEVGEAMLIFSFGSGWFLFLLFVGIDDLKCFGVVFVVSIVATDSWVNSKFRFFLWAVRFCAAGSFPINILCFYDFFDTFIVFRFVMAYAFVVLRLFCSVRTAIMTFMLYFCFLHGSRMELSEKRLIGFFELFDISFGIFQKISLFAF